jgi:hypothetical protein
MALLFASSPYTRGFAATALVLSIMGAWLANRHIGRRAFPSLFAPLAGAVTALAMLAVGLRQGLEGGIRWRGTFYQSSLLRAGQRILMPVPWGKMPRPD